MKQWFIMMILLSATWAHADLVRQTVQYKQGDTALEGYLVYNEDEVMTQELKPGIIVVHEWMGLNDYAKSRADQLAQLGYVAFAADIYGKGVRPNTPALAGAEAGKYKSNRALLRSRVVAALEQIKSVPRVDPDRIAAIGYCFGGTAVLELARSGADIKGVVSFHGGLSAGDISNQAIKAKILVLHGEDDPFVPPTEVEGFKQEMKASQADYRIVTYPEAMHGFTNPNNKGEIPGALYQAEADQQSWQEMQKFLTDVVINQGKAQ